MNRLNIRRRFLSYEHRPLWTMVNYVQNRLPETSVQIDFFRIKNRLWITVTRYRTRTSPLASEVTHFSSVKSNVSNYLQLHVKLNSYCRLPYHTVSDPVYSFKNRFDLENISLKSFLEKWVSS